ncbi:MAG TPA: septum site-determining protein MinC [Polyangia bacterium]|nr:septum site-determining protein MinC [Polyangia bacterium]
MSDASPDGPEAAEDVPCAPLFATETMAELSARQGRTADAVSIYRHLLRGAESDPAAADRIERWRSRLLELEGGAGAGSAKAPPAAVPARSQAPAPAAPPLRTALVVRDPVRSGQVIYADGRDLVVMAPVNPGAQLLADGHIHVYGPLKGRAVAGARGMRDAQVFCLALEAELVGVDTGYVVSADVPEALWGGPARVFLSPDGTCVLAALPLGKPAATRSPALARIWR